MDSGRPSTRMPPRLPPGASRGAWHQSGSTTRSSRNWVANAGWVFGASAVRLPKRNRQIGESGSCRRSVARLHSALVEHDGLASPCWAAAARLRTGQIRNHPEESGRVLP